MATTQTNVYTKSFTKALVNLFENNSRVKRSFGGTLQVTDGIAIRDIFMELKVRKINSVISDYDLSKTYVDGRFSDPIEVVSQDLQIPYEKPIGINNYVDVLNTNDNYDEQIMAVIIDQAEQVQEYIEQLLYKALSDNSTETFGGDDMLDSKGVENAFSVARARFTNAKVGTNVARVAYVNPQVYNVILKHHLTTSGKNSAVNIDNGTITDFLGFVVIETPDSYFPKGEHIFFVADNVGVAGVGVADTTTKVPEKNHGTIIQTVGKYGKHIPDENKKAIYKAKFTKK